MKRVTGDGRREVGDIELRWRRCAPCGGLAGEDGVVWGSLGKVYDVLKVLLVQEIGLGCVLVLVAPTMAEIAGDKEEAGLGTFL